MASKQTTLDFILEQMATAGVIASKKMFGEYGIYCDTKIVALVCDDQLFIKPTAAGKTFIGNFTEKPPYPGAKPYLYISGDLWEDAEWLSELIKVSAKELPLPAPKKPRKKALKSHD